MSLGSMLIIPVLLMLQLPRNSSVRNDKIITTGSMNNERDTNYKNYIYIRDIIINRNLFFELLMFL